MPDGFASVRSEHTITQLGVDAQATTYGPGSGNDLGSSTLNLELKAEICIVTGKPGVDAQASTPHPTKPLERVRKNILFGIALT